jgi:NAD(P)-dependent dehydrogenase (short-subunit alcohol dehydrogenase family)
MKAERLGQSNRVHQGGFEVSGSTAGIGLAVATALASEGASVVVNGRTEARVAAAVRQIGEKAKDAQVRGVAADLGTASGVETLLKHAPEADVLVNNLGIFEVKPFLEIPDADWLRFFEVNVLSGVRLTRFYLPGMQRNRSHHTRLGSLSPSHTSIVPGYHHCGAPRRCA